jgi:nitrite reductase (NO-forming)
MNRTRPFIMGAWMVSVVLVACASGRIPGSSPEVSAAAQPPETAMASMSMAATPATTPVSGPTAEANDTIHIRAFDLGFEPRQITVPEPGTYTFVMDNTGAIPHDLTFPDGTTNPADPGMPTAPATVLVPAEGLDFWCSLPGHREAGMAGHISVAGSAASPAASQSPDSHGGPPPAVPVVDPDPNAPAYTLYDPVPPPLMPGNTHDIELRVEETMMTVAPGYQVAVWTFNGTVPGPVIRVKLGDKVRVHLVNPASNQLSHSVDFHASQVAWNDEMTSIKPGEEKIYEWTADYAGVWMYHCGTAPALHHIANGMYGMVIVEPRGGLAPVDREFALVQSEWYIDAQGTPASLTKASAGAPAPDFVVFNGVANQYADNPLAVGTGERVRFFVLDAGPNIDSSFHIVGTIFDEVTKEGFGLVRGNDGGWGSQAVDLSPAQGAIIETTTAEDGLYPIVTHAFNFVGRGALGLLKAGDGDPLK